MSAAPQIRPRPARILVVEDQLSLALLYKEYLTKSGHTVETVERAEDALKLLRADLPDLVIADVQLPGMSGLELLRTVRAEGLPVAAIVITANGSITKAVEAMQAGAYDFVLKPFTAERLTTTVANAMERKRLESLVEALADEGTTGRRHGFIGSSPAMQAVYRIIDSAAASKATVFITGESGTGKEVCAEAVHRASGRRARPFVALNCAAIPKDLIESEIFGHVKGAFTGATADREGAAAKADGGTLFLDELCEMNLDLQAKLLRFIQTGTFQPVGSSRVEKVDIRFVCATNRDPLTEVREGRFREDLYYRLHVIPIALPPLRERSDDALEIGRVFLAEMAAEEKRRFKGFTPDVEEVLRRYPWPGNVRQLQNTIRNIVVLNDGDLVTQAMLPPPLLSTAAMPPPGTMASTPAVAYTTTPVVAGDAIVPLWKVEREAIERAIGICSGNIPRAAAMLEVAPSTLYRKIQSWATGPV